MHVPSTKGENMTLRRNYIASTYAGKAELSYNSASDSSDEALTQALSASINIDADCTKVAQAQGIDWTQHGLVGSCKNESPQSPTDLHIKVKAQTTNSTQEDAEQSISAWRVLKTGISTDGNWLNHQMIGGTDSHPPIAMVNLPRLAIEAHGDARKFYSSLALVVKMACCQLAKNADELGTKPLVKLQPQIFIVEDDTELDLNNDAQLAVRFTGLAEALVALVGKHHGESDQAWNIGLEIISHMRELIDAQAKNAGINFTLSALSNGDLAHQMMEQDCKLFGRLQGITDRDRYTEGFQVPSYFKASLCKRICCEGPFHALCNGGAITEITVDGDLSKNPEAKERLTSFMLEHGIVRGIVRQNRTNCRICGCL